MWKCSLKDNKKEFDKDLSGLEGFYVKCVLCCILDSSWDSQLGNAILTAVAQN